MKRLKAERKLGRATAEPRNPQQGPAEQKFSEVIGAFAEDSKVAYGGGKGFGSTALKVQGKLFAMISSKGHFVVKLPRDRVDELVRLGTGQYFSLGRRGLMKEWIAIAGKEALWIRLATEARRFVGGQR